MKKLENYLEDVMISSTSQQILGGKDWPSKVGPDDNPYMTDVHHDIDDDGIWSEGDSFSFTKIRE